MTRPTARVLALLALLQSGGDHTVAALADRLGVDERTVRRYAVHLADLGIPVEARRGRYGGYRLSPGYKLPPLMFTDDEAVAVVLGLVAGKRAGLVAAVDSALAKVTRVLPRSVAGRVDPLLSEVAFTSVERAAVPPETQVLLTLAGAAREHRTVEISYTSWDGRQSVRELDPYGLVFHTGRWYVTGRDHRRAALRTFRLDRMGHARAGTATFEPPADFDPTAHVMAGLAAVPYAHDVSVVLEADPAEARRRLPPTVGTLTEVDGGVRLSARAERLDGMARMLAGLGWPFRIEYPDALRDEVRALARALERYAG